MEYWIEGYFTLFWGGKAFHDEDQEIFIPVFAIENLNWFESAVPSQGWTFEQIIDGRVEIKSSFAKAQLQRLELLKKTRQFTWQNKKHCYLQFFCDALNKRNDEKIREEPIEVPPTGLP